MYLQINLPEQDRPYHRFLWRFMNPCRQPEVFEFNRVVFGVTASPFLAQYVTQQHAKMHQQELPRAAETVVKSTYMDDSMDSVENEDQGKELYQQLSQMWSRAGMHARKWLSNSLSILENIPPEDRASEVDISEGHLPSVKTLGLLWRAEKDIFAFKCELKPEKAVTKRSLLSCIARLFDPLGLISPFSVQARILLQRVWTSGLDWDDEIAGDLKANIEMWVSEIQMLQQAEVPRCLRLEGSCSVEYHVFVDASEEAYGACVYTVHTYQNNDKSSRLVAAKGKVAPLNAVSIPRLELLAAMVGLRLAVSVTEALQSDLSSVRFWSDSVNVLCWIRNSSRTFKAFVANRVSEIQSITDPSQWNHVPTEMNPADMLSRGLSAPQLLNSRLWWSGPPFLIQEVSEWPKNPTLSTKSTAEKRSSSVTTMVTVDTNTPFRLDPVRFSNWKKLLSVTAWTYRFLYNCQNKEKLTGELTPEEIKEAETKIVAKTQNEAFTEYATLLKKQSVPTSSKLLGLRPVIDEEGLMRLGGRLDNADCLSLETKHPIILPRRNWLTKLIVKHYHEQGNHRFGTNQTLAEISARFWNISAREEIKEWERECCKCKRNKAKPSQPIMAPLPKIRVSPSTKAFSEIGVDFAGPFLTKQGRARTKTKRYLCLFTCLTTRAVHLEMAYGLDTDSFLNAFYRMVNRRGLPQVVISDNGTNFVGAVRELKQLVNLMDKNTIQRSLANKGVKWLFNPPQAPHFGGVFETMIKAAKRAIYAILSQSDVTDEDLTTAMTGAEALINSRPLTYQSAHPNDETPLTPNHFLHGQIGGVFAPESVDTSDYHPRKRWRRIQELVRHFWRRWMREWLPSLNARHKWKRPCRDIKTNDVVLVISPNTPRGQWHLGIITNTYQGTDGHVRVADVRVGKNIMTRPVNRVCLLEWSDEGAVTDDAADDPNVTTAPVDEDDLTNAATAGEDDANKAADAADDEDVDAA